jgi:hypothetical protein
MLVKSFRVRKTRIEKTTKRMDRLVLDFDPKIAERPGMVDSRNNCA